MKSEPLTKEDIKTAKYRCMPGYINIENMVSIDRVLGLVEWYKKEFELMHRQAWLGVLLKPVIEKLDEGVEQIIDEKKGENE